MEWTIAEEDRKLSEIADKALQDGPQRVLRDEESVIVISEDEYRALKGNDPKRNEFLEYLMSGPGLEGLDLTRDKSPMREIEW